MVYNKLFRNGIIIALGVALLFRLCLLLMTPNLTDDHFRFIWDGLLIANGYNPYLILPSEFIKSAETVPGISVSLFEQLNSPDYYTVYPPICQAIFGLSAKIFGNSILGNVVFMRFLILLAEFGSITLLYKFTRLFQSAPNLILIYALNPLVIIELTGNLHFEAFMVFFVLLAVYSLIKKRHVFSAIAIAFAIGTKLLPLILLPLLIKRIGIRKSFIYFAIVGGVLLILAAPFINGQSVSNFVSSISLYFQSFEFNASIYYLARWMGFQITGYNTIAITGIVLSVISFLVILTIIIREKSPNLRSLFTIMLLCMTVYFLFATTVHPWYLTTLVMLSVFAPYTYMLPWSLLVVLTYATYRTFPYSENLWLIAAEYLIVGGWMVYELKFRRKQKELRGAVQ
jgi:hypothetical protein